VSRASFGSTRFQCRSTTIAGYGSCAASNVESASRTASISGASSVVSANLGAYPAATRSAFGSRSGTFERLGEVEYELTARSRATGLDERQVTRREPCVAREPSWL